MKKFKLYVGLALIALVVIFALQNNDLIELDFLVWRFSLSRIVLIVGSMIIGVIASWLISAFYLRK
jgi:lipopolysaccharide assembly protein A